MLTGVAHRWMQTLCALVSQHSEAWGTRRITASQTMPRAFAARRHVLRILKSQPARAFLDMSKNQQSFPCIAVEGFRQGAHFSECPPLSAGRGTPSHVWGSMNRGIGSYPKVQPLKDPSLDGFEVCCGVSF